MINNTSYEPWLGCIADDYTGASDLASFLVASGLRTLQINGLPNQKQLKNIKNVDAVVIALKSRTIAVKKAVNISLDALKILQLLGCQKYYFKYCSTFDSTPKGNIGPVIDALMNALSIDSTVICPALPINGRTVYQGHLFVFDQLLSDSPMKDHPLTPMVDSSLLRMIEQQGKGKASLVDAQILDKGSHAISKAFKEAKQRVQYIVVDAIHNQHLNIIGQNLSSFKLITGGSGLAIGLSVEFQAQGGVLVDAQTTVKGQQAPTLVISGSCSAMTQKQVAAYSTDHPVFNLDVNKLANGELTVTNICEWLNTVKTQAPLITATAPPEVIVANQQKLGADYVAQLIEQTFAQLAIAAKDALGFRNFVVAGGETSGAVVNALNVDQFYIGKTIAPGVPMVQTLDKNPLNLALKSGNFGQEDFFYKAVETLTCY